MTLSELEALAKAARVTKHPHPNTLLHQADVRAYRSAANPDTILQMIALIRQIGDALEVASDLTTPYDDCECPICKAVDAWKEFKHGAKVL